MISGRNKLEKDYFLICPVRGATNIEKTFIENTIDNYEKKGVGIHYPLWDTNQNDPIGYDICTENKNGIKNAKKGVLIYLNESSAGSMFDLGMTFMSGQPLTLINNFSDFDKLGDDLGKIISDYIFNPENKSEKYKVMNSRKEMIKKDTNIWHIFNKDKFYLDDKLTPKFLFEFGMKFMKGGPMKILNPWALPLVEGKSFESVLWHLDKLAKEKKHFKF